MQRQGGGRGGCCNGGGRDEVSPALPLAAPSRPTPCPLPFFENYLNFLKIRETI